MSDKPILFSGPMVRAILDGRKTMTRRVLKPQPHIQPELHEPFDGAPFWCCFNGDEIGYRVRVPFVTGDRLYVREEYSFDHSWTGVPPRDVMPAAPVHYWADGNPQRGDWTKPKPGMHMPRWASRLTLIVTDVRVQRLQDISEDDAWAEGCVKGDPDHVGGFFPAEEPDPSGIGYRGWDNARDWFGDLWDGLNAKRGFGWDVNPWVCAVTFTAHQRNIDQLEAVHG